MTDAQFDLFAGPYTGYDGRPPHERVSTSEAAAVSIEKVANRLQQVTYDAIREREKRGATDDELEQITGLKHQTVSARRRELYLRGLIVNDGERPTRSGRRAKVWVLR